MTGFQRALKQAMSECCLSLAAKEVERDFPLLRLNQSTEAHRLVAAFQTLPPRERLQTALAFATVAPERTSRQFFLFETFRTRTSQHSIAELEGMPMCPLEEEERNRQPFLVATDAELAFVRQSIDPLPKARIKHCFLAKLRDKYEQRICSVGALEYECVTAIGSWRLVTDLDFGGHFQFRVGILLEHDNLPTPAVGGGATLGSMLGLGELGWDSVRRESLENDAEAAVALCTEMRSHLTRVALSVAP